jgi:hypothetical protein
MKACSRCNVEKPLEDFYPDKSKKDGRHGTCKECQKADRKARYEADPETHKARMKAWQKANGDKIAARRRRMREEVIEAYGGRCACCGLTGYEFLTIDHTNGDGAEHRKVIGEGATDILNYLRANGYPKDRFRLLCWNCNCARGIYGYCPHEKEGPNSA